ncbi:penicillin-binding protein 2 [Actinomyces sp. F1_1611]
MKEAPPTVEGQTAPDPRQHKSRQRSRWFGALTVLALTVCAIQLFSIQIIRGPALAEQGRKVRTSATEVSAPRGKIVDASGQILVDSVETYHIAVNQKNILEWKHRDEDGKLIGQGPADAAEQLAPLLKMDPAELGGMMLGDSTYAYLAKNVDAATFRKIKALGIYGIEWEPVYQRAYPGGNTAASIIGSVDANGLGNSGLELVYDDVLTGIPGEESFEIGPTGEVIPGAKTVSKEARTGGTVHTTIDADLQNSVQEYLDQAVKTYEADWGSVVVLDVATSRVLAMGDSGLQSPAKGPQPSGSVQWVIEPGSVGKILTVATALEQGTVTPDTVFSVPDRYETKDGEVITDIHEHETYQRTVAGIITESSNTGAVQIGETVTDQARHETMSKLGLGKLTGIELPGESPGILAPAEDWLGRSIYTTMFGQGYAMTPLQEAAMMAAIGNGGVWQGPRLVSGTTDANGKFHAEETPEPVQAIQPETAQILLKMMEGVSTDAQIGTGTAAAVEGYRVAIKTGTSELPSGGTVATVAGVLPADKPQLAIAVVLNNPRSGYLSSDSAAPLFHQVASAAVTSLGIPGSTGPVELYPTAP